MTKSSNATKRALLVSALSIVMCLAMLIGTTFAWFTDTASTGLNKIQAGNLDVKLSYKNKGSEKFTEVDTETKVFDENALWEPGYVEYVVLKVENAGTLALKYKLGINIASEKGSKNVNGKEFKLSDYIKFAVVEGDLTTIDGFNRADLVKSAEETGANNFTGYSKEVELLEKDGYNIVTLVVWMPTNVGNDANYATGNEAPEINFGINVVATQAVHENDSFDNKYDETAEYPVIINTQTDFEDAIASADAETPIEVQLAPGTFALPNENMADKDITISGTADTVIDMKKVATGQATGGAKIKFSGVTIELDKKANHMGIQHSSKVVYENCTIKGKQCLWATDVEFINCKIENEDDYAVWTYGAKNVTFTGCEFNSNVGRAVLCYIEGGGQTFNYTFDKCNFKNSGTVAEKSAIMINPTANAGETNTYTVNINNCTVGNYAVDENTNKAIIGIKNETDAPVKDNITVNIDGTTVYTH